MSIILALLIFSVIVIVHELGHFLLAKYNGITVTEFSEEAMKEIQEAFTDYWYDKAKAISEETSDMLTWEIDVVNNN